jgi:hypothetical protein
VRSRESRPPVRAIEVRGGVSSGIRTKFGLSVMAASDDQAVVAKTSAQPLRNLIQS